MRTIQEQGIDSERRSQARSGTMWLRYLGIIQECGMVRSTRLGQRQAMLTAVAILAWALIVAVVFGVLDITLPGGSGAALSLVLIPVYLAAPLAALLFAAISRTTDERRVENRATLLSVILPIVPTVLVALWGESHYNLSVGDAVIGAVGIIAAGSIFEVLIGYWFAGFGLRFAKTRHLRM